jgi:hypothetical protein
MKMTTMMAFLLNEKCSADLEESASSCGAKFLLLSNVQTVVALKKDTERAAEREENIFADGKMRREEMNEWGSCENIMWSVCMSD